MATTSTPQAVGKIVVGGITVAIGLTMMKVGGTVIAEGAMYGLKKATEALVDVARND